MSLPSNVTDISITVHDEYNRATPCLTSRSNETHYTAIIKSRWKFSIRVELQHTFSNSCERCRYRLMNTSSIGRSGSYNIYIYIYIYIYMQLFSKCAIACLPIIWNTIIYHFRMLKCKGIVVWFRCHNVDIRKVKLNYNLLVNALKRENIFDKSNSTVRAVEERHICRQSLMFAETRGT